MAEPLNKLFPLEGADVMDLLKFWRTQTKHLYTVQKGKPFFFIVTTPVGPIPVIINEAYLDSVWGIIEHHLQTSKREEKGQSINSSATVESRAGPVERCPFCSVWHDRDWRLIHSAAALPKENRFLRGGVRANCL